jgi:hypothetical protein
MRETHRLPQGREGVEPPCTNFEEEEEHNVDDGHNHLRLTDPSLSRRRRTWPVPTPNLERKGGIEEERERETTTGLRRAEQPEKWRGGREVAAADGGGRWRGGEGRKGRAAGEGNEGVRVRGPQGVLARGVGGGRGCSQKL